MTRILTAVVLALGLAACSMPGPREREAARLAQYLDFAGEQIESFHFWEIDSWERLGPRTLAVWTTIHDAYLIELKPHCSGLEFATTIGLSSINNRVTQRHDAVLFENSRCRIESIREVDGRGLRAARREGRYSDKG